MSDSTDVMELIKAKTKAHRGMTFVVLLFSTFGVFVGLAQKYVGPFYGKEGIPPSLWATVLIISFLMAFIFVKFLTKPGGQDKHHTGKPTFGLKDDAAFVLHRNRLISEIKERLTNNPNQRIWAVTGASGSGKSYLFRKLIQGDLSTPDSPYFPAKPCDNMATFIGEILEFYQEHQLGEAIDPDRIDYPILREPNSVKGKVVLVFDQFEDFLRLSTPDDRDRFHAFLEETIRVHDATVFVITRHEYYYDLRFLNDISNRLDETADLMSATIEVGKIDHLNQPNHTVTAEFIEEIGKILGHDGCIKAIKDDLAGKESLLPIELQIIGRALEDMARESCKGSPPTTRQHEDPARGCAPEDKPREPFKGSPLTAKQYGDLGGLTGLIRRFFEGYISKSTCPDAAKACLYVLSVKSSMGRVFDKATLSGLTGWDETTVVSALEPLVEAKIVLVTDNEGYRMSHDYCAERLYEYSEQLLHPVLRDNLTFFADRHSRDLPDAAKASAERVVVRPVAGVLRWLFVPFFVVVAAKLFGQYLLPSSWLPFLHLPHGETGATSLTLRGLLNAPFLPAALASLGTGIYTWHILKNFLLQLGNREEHIDTLSLMAWFLSYGVLWLLVFFSPRWPIWIALGGSVIGMRVVLASKGTEKMFPWIQRLGSSILASVLGSSGKGGVPRPLNYIAGMGLTTLLNMLAIGVAGAMYIGVRDKVGLLAADDRVAMGPLEAVFAFLIATLLLSVDRKHGSPAASVMHLGSIERIRASNTNVPGDADKGRQ